MKKTTSILLLLFLTLISCNTKTEIIEGDLYFKLIDFGSFYGGDMDKIEKDIDSLRFLKNISDLEIEFIELYDKLKNNNIIYNPYIYIKTDTIIRRVYMDEKDYKKVKDYKWSELSTKNKKVTLKIKIEELDKDIFYSHKIIEYKEVDGQTYWKK